MSEGNSIEETVEAITERDQTLRRPDPIHSEGAGDGVDCGHQPLSHFWNKNSGRERIEFFADHPSPIGKLIISGRLECGRSRVNVMIPKKHEPQRWVEIL